MRPNIKVAVGMVLDKYSSEARKEYNSFYPNKRPKDHIFVYLDQLKKLYLPVKNVPAKVDEQAIRNLMVSLKITMNACTLSEHEEQWCHRVLDEVAILCLKDRPASKEQEEMKGKEITLEQARDMLLARMRSILTNINIPFAGV